MSLVRVGLRSQPLSRLEVPDFAVVTQLFPACYENVPD